MNRVISEEKMQEKSEGVATLLAVLLGIVGLYGVGHMYVGRIGRGLIILFGDWIIGAGALVCFAIAQWAGALVLAAVSLALWIWQIFDARSVCRQNNAKLNLP